MTEQLLDDLRTLGTLLERTSATISLDDIVGSRSTSVDDARAEAPPAFDAAVAAHLAVVTAQAVPPTRPARARVVAAILVAAAVIGALWIVNTRPEQQQPATNPPAGAAHPSENADQINAYPLLDASDLPSGTVDGDLVGIWSGGDKDQGWSAFYGAPGSDGVPTSLVQATMFPPGSGLPIADAAPGRVEGVSEIGTTIQWMVDDTPFTLAAADVDLLYSIRPLLQPAADGAGFALTGPLPTGIVELDPPRHHPATWSPGVGSAGGTTSINVFVYDLSPYMLLTLSDVAAVTVGGRPGFIGSGHDQVDLAFAVSVDETVFLSSSVLSREELIAVAEKVRFTDEPTWRDHYGIDWGGDSAGSSG